MLTMYDAKYKHKAKPKLQQFAVPYLASSTDEVELDEHFLPHV